METTVERRSDYQRVRGFIRVLLVAGREIRYLAQRRTGVGILAHLDEVSMTVTSLFGFGRSCGGVLSGARCTTWMARSTVVLVTQNASVVPSWR
ncbi:hypothetical protein ID866_11819 [Astraeus odoratus]|nr:hypothetical protein ID866_11819 [Astraeus odoratus]